MPFLKKAKHAQTRPSSVHESDGEGGSIVDRDVWMKSIRLAIAGIEVKSKLDNFTL
jgi:hypothetical protein